MRLLHLQVWPLAYCWYELLLVTISVVSKVILDENIVARSLEYLHCFFSVFLMFQWLYIQVAKDPSGKLINALEQHIKNLLCPSTPFFFNTLYDPYTEGADFVRGYPFSLREGAPTAVSHGLWLNIPDYDAPTQLVKPRERNTRYVFKQSKLWTCLF